MGNRSDKSSAPWDTHGTLTNKKEPSTTTQSKTENRYLIVLKAISFFLVLSKLVSVGLIIPWSLVRVQVGPPFSRVYIPADLPGRQLSLRILLSPLSLAFGPVDAMVLFATYSCPHVLTWALASQNRHSTPALTSAFLTLRKNKN